MCVWCGCGGGCGLWVCVGMGVGVGVVWVWVYGVGVAVDVDVILHSYGVQQQSNRGEYHEGIVVLVTIIILVRSDKTKSKEHMPNQTINALPTSCVLPSLIQIP